MLQSPQTLLTIRALNLAFEKEVFVRMTDDGWATQRDIPCSYISTSDDARADRFGCALQAPLFCKRAVELEFAICFRVSGTEYWDNNQAKNYRVTVEPM